MTNPATFSRFPRSMQKGREDLPRQLIDTISMHNLYLGVAFAGIDLDYPYKGHSPYTV
jgi:hypothetical protein